MKNFTVRAIVFYFVALVACLTFTGIANVSLYLLLANIGLSEFGNLLAFRIGLALVEVSICVLMVQEASEDILFFEDFRKEKLEQEVIPNEEAL